MDNVLQTMKLGKKIASDVEKFRLNIRNRRLKVDKDGAGDRFEPVFKGTLWKVKADGDRMKEEDWFEREMWIAKNGSLVYYSKKEERDLVYYTPEDIEKAKLVLIDNSKSFRSWTFQVQLKFSGDIEFAPGEFAAASEALRKEWVAEFKKVQKKFKGEKSKSQIEDGAEKPSSPASPTRKSKAESSGQEGVTDAKPDAKDEKRKSEKGKKSKSKDDPKKAEGKKKSEKKSEKDKGEKE